jgi:hypothetical protein
MKKLFVLLAVASLGFVACNNSASDDEAKRIADSTHTADSLTAVQKTADSLANAQKMMDTASKMAPDTTKAKAPAKKK